MSYLEIFLPVAVAVFPLGLAHLFTLGILGPVVQSFVSLKGKYKEI